MQVSFQGLAVEQVRLLSAVRDLVLMLISVCVCVCVCARARPLETCHSYMFDRSCQKPTSDLGTLPSQSQGWGAHGMSERS